MFKKITTFLLFLVLPVLAVFSAVNYSEAISENKLMVMLDGKDATALASPVIENGRTLVQIRFISEEMGATVAWDGVERTVTVAKGNNNTFLRIGSYLVQYNDGTVYNLSDVAPRIINDRTYVPIRLIGNALGIGVDWDQNTRTVILDSKKTSDITPFFDVKIISPKSGYTITGETSVQVSIPESSKDLAEEMKLLLLDKDTGKGFVAAHSKMPSSSIDYLPRIEDKGEKLLVAALYDANGKFIGGDTIQVNIDVRPKITLTGLKDGDIVKETASIGQNLNFLAYYVKYVLTNQDSGKVITFDHQDPQGAYSWSPTMNQNGSYSIKVIAYDGNGTTYESQSISVKADVDRRLFLTGVSAGAIINKPVTLLASRNFDVSETQYVIKDVKTGEESILATIPYGQYVWFPGPEFSGNKELLVRVRDVRRVVYASSPINVKVDGVPKLLLKGIGPKQVVTGETKLSVNSNVKLDNVSYVLTEASTGIKRTLAADSNQGATFTPSKTDPSDMAIQAEGTYQGKKIISESVPFSIYLGAFYGSKPIIEKDKFLGLVSNLAKDSSSKTGMSTALQIAQAILETGWGQNVPVDKYNGKFSYNLFGIKGTGTNGSVVSNTWEVYNGVSYRIDAAFKAYNNLSESWDDRNKLLLTASRYAPFRAVMYDSTLGAWAVKRAGYATDPLYPIKLINIIDQYHLLELDKVGI